MRVIRCQNRIRAQNATRSAAFDAEPRATQQWSPADVAPHPAQQRNRSQRKLPPGIRARPVEVTPTPRIDRGGVGEQDDSVPQSLSPAVLAFTPCAAASALAPPAPSRRGSRSKSGSAPTRGSEYPGASEPTA